MNTGTTNVSPRTAPAVTPSPPLLDAAAAETMESNAIQTYRPPGCSNDASMTTMTASMLTKPVEWVHNPDGSPLMDHQGRPISVDKLLATKPLRHELCTRPGPGNRKLTYLSGEGVTRTLNDIFGYDGWNMDIKNTSREECVKDDKGRYHVAYTATVRLTHRRSGAYKEDCGAGDAIDRALGTAVANALKASITDAMKRAARHFGDKLGNSLYQGTFSLNKAPNTLQQALDQHEIERANTKFGFPKDQKPAPTPSTTSNVPVSGVPPPCAIKGVPPPSAIKITGIRTPAPPPPCPSSAIPLPNRTASVPPFHDSESKSGQVQSKPEAHTQEHSAQQRPTNTTGKIMNTNNTVPSLQAGKTAPGAPPPVSTRAPPSAKQKLETSGLFDLSAFAAGSPLLMNARHPSDNNSNNASDQNNKTETSSSSEFDVFDTPRPGTSTGVRASAPLSGPLVLGSNKRPAPLNKETDSSQNQQKKPANMNPYLNPSM